MYYIGIDAGGTKTALYAADRQKSQVFEAVGKGINFWRIEEQEAVQILKDLIQQAQNHFKGTKIGGIVGGFAGASRLAAMKNVEQQIKDTFCDKIHFLSDAVVTLEGAFGAESGIMAVVGTGSNVLGKSRDGSVVQTGGWGWMIGDEASGMRLSLDALALVSKALDTDAPTAMRLAAEDFFGFSGREGLLTVVYRSQTQLQTFAPIIISLAENGDKEAQWLLYQHAQEIAVQVNRLWGKYPDLSPRVAFSGGLIRKNPYYQQLVERHIQKLAFRQITFVEPLYTPTIGAWQMAQRKDFNSVRSG